MLSEAVRQRMAVLVARHAAVMEQMTDGNVQAGKELASLAPVARLHEQLLALDEEESSLKDLLREAAGDEDMEAECQKEIERIQEKRTKLDEQALAAVLPRDPDDFEADAILEIRAGTGGDEAALFSAELLEAYIKTAKAKGWNVEVLHEGRTDLGGVRDAVISIAGRGGVSYDYSDDGESADILSGLSPYGFFKFESGGHRVQRVPVNDVRIHTSACSVAVLPSPSVENTDPETLVPASELRIETMRASGAGGQHVNTTDSAVRITHIPTGITAAIQDERSQHKNKAKAMKLVTARVRDRQREQEARERGEVRNTLMGGGDRSERIRTYNFPQDRITDHRSKQSEHGIRALLDGGPEDGLVVTFAPSIRMLHRDELVKQLEEEK
jgi:peptide chain release factor 1